MFTFIFSYLSISASQCNVTQTLRADKFIANCDNNFKWFCTKSKMFDEFGSNGRTMARSIMGSICVHRNKYTEQKCTVVMLATTRLAGVAPQMKLLNPVETRGISAQQKLIKKNRWTVCVGIVTGINRRT